MNARHPSKILIIQKITTSYGYDYTNNCLLNYTYFKENYKLIAIDPSKQQILDADPKAMQQINFTGNLERAKNRTTFFNMKEVKEIILDFSQETVRVL